MSLRPAADVAREWLRDRGAECYVARDVEALTALVERVRAEALREAADLADSRVTAEAITGHKAAMRTRNGQGDDGESCLRAHLRQSVAEDVRDRILALIPARLDHDGGGAPADQDRIVTALKMLVYASSRVSSNPWLLNDALTQASAALEAIGVKVP